MSEKLSKEQIKEKIETDEDFVYAPKFDNSLDKLMQEYPDGLENNKIAKHLCLEESTVEYLFRSAVAKLKSLVGDR
jgi:DNA-binding NarL/FixJ family response regulator